MNKLAVAGGAFLALCLGLVLILIVNSNDENDVTETLAPPTTQSQNSPQDEDPSFQRSESDALRSGDGELDRNFDPDTVDDQSVIVGDINDLSLIHI